jgi:hypothetical protein
MEPGSFNSDALATTALSWLNLAFSPGAVAVPGELGAGLRGMGWLGSLPLRGAAFGLGCSGHPGKRLGGWQRAACDAERTWDASPEFSLARGPDLRVAFCCR